MEATLQRNLTPTAQPVLRKPRPRLSVGLARGRTEIIEAMRLRYRVFAGEMGARLATRVPGVDEDRYDDWCDHLIARNDDTGEVVGTYRILAPENAARIGYYSESEFDLARLAPLRPRLVEIGRSCVAPDYRTGGTIALLWSGLAQYMRERDYDYLMGCASVSMGDGGHHAASLYRALTQGPDSALGPAEYRVFPHCPLPMAALRQDVPGDVPPLIKGYLRAGAWICGTPAWDPDFNTADLPILMPMARISDRYGKHFLRGQD